MATPAQENAIHRTVVLLRPSEKKHLQTLARQHNVSASEIVRRSLNVYAGSVTQSDEEDLKALFSQMNEGLDAALASVRSARTEVAKNLSQIKKRKGKHA